MDWSTPIGVTRIVTKTANPSWYPPQAVLAEHEANGDPLPAVIPPGPDNPLGARALYLLRDGRDTLYRIHGTNQPSTIGERVSSGCIRMANGDVIDLYGRVQVGTKVVVLPDQAPAPDLRAQIESTSVSASLATVRVRTSSLH